MDQGDTTARVAPHVRRLRARALGHRLRESLVFLPVLVLSLAVLVEASVAAVDRRWPTAALPVFRLSPQAATALLTTIAGATITTAGVVFSLLVVSLQLASGQFSPRVLRSFWRDQFGQLLIGVLLATFVFCGLALSQVSESAATAPALTVTCAMALALASVIAIVMYLNRISRHQYVGLIAERVAGEARALVAELPYGDHIGMWVGVPVSQPDLSSLGDPLVVYGHANGWVQQISRRAVLAALPPGSVARIETRVGAFLLRDEPLVTIWPKPDTRTASRVSELVARSTIVGPARTMQQDIDFGLRQLNDIALRALSPAVNDPTTAVEVIMWIASIMRPLVRADLPEQCVRDDAGRVLLTPWDLDHAEYIAHGFDQLRLYAAGHPQVLTSLVRTLLMLRANAAEAGRAHLVEVVNDQVRLTLAGAARAGLLPEDLARIGEIAASAA